MRKGITQGLLAIFAFLVTSLSSIDLSESASVPGNCAQDVTKLSQLLSGAHHLNLPNNFAHSMYGRWQGSKQGHEVSIDLLKAGANQKLFVGVHVRGPFKNISPDAAPLTICVDNTNFVKAIAVIENKRQSLNLEIPRADQIQVQNSKLSGTYSKTANF